MNPQEMLTELNENYKVLKAQFQKADLSQIPPLKLAELMYKHLVAMQKVMKMMADQQQTPPPKSPQPSRDRQGADNSASSTPKAPTTPSAAVPQSPKSEIINPKSKIPSPAPDQDILAILRGSSGISSADLARKLGRTPTPASKEPNASLQVPSRASPR